MTAHLDSDRPARTFTRSPGGILALTLVAMLGTAMVAEAQVATPMLAGGFSHTLALLPNGTVKVCGDNGMGQLGLGTGTINWTVPTLQQIPASSLNNVVAVAAGDSHSLALLSNGTVKAWGIGASGELGLGNTSIQITPQQIPAGSLSNVIAIDAGWMYSLALLSNGTVKSWGYNYAGQLGLGSSGSAANQLTPQQIPASSLSNVVAIAMGDAHCVALLSNGTVKVWGDNSMGQLGLGNIPNQSTPQPIPASSLSSVVAIAAGGAHSLALCSNGEVVAWGDNNAGQLGMGFITSQLTPLGVPQRIPASSLSGVVAIAAGAMHSFAVLSDGTVKTWGGNPYGALGLGLVALPGPQTTPLLIPANSLNSVSRIAAGTYHSLAILSDGRAKSWGTNSPGQLGLGNNAGQITPQVIPGLCLSGFLGYSMHFGALGNAAVGMSIPCNSVTAASSGQNHYFNTFTADSLNSAIPGGGAWYGLHTTQAEVIAWLNLGSNGFPLALGPLSATGGAAVSVSIPPGSLSGLTIYGVSVAFNPLTFVVAANSPVASHTF